MYVLNVHLVQTDEYVIHIHNIHNILKGSYWAHEKLGEHEKAFCALSTSQLVLKNSR